MVRVDLKYLEFLLKQFEKDEITYEMKLQLKGIVRYGRAARTKQVRKCLECEHYINRKNNT